MKKMLSLVMAITMCLSLSACSGGTTSQGESSQSPAASTPAASSSQGASSTPADAESDLAYVQDQGTLYVGITNFAPMDYKVQELDSKTIDCVWNGMTINDEVTAAMGVSEPYCTNYQTLVYPADRAADFEGLTSLEGLSIAVESGSAGEDAAEELGATTVPVQSQANTLMEVASGTSDAAVIDVLMAAEMTGEGTSYGDLVYDLNLNDMRAEASEFYGVGFRKGSDLVDAFNEFWKQAVADGTVEQIAATYGLQDAVILE